MFHSSPRILSPTCLRPSHTQPKKKKKSHPTNKLLQSEDFPRVQAKAAALGTKLEYRRIDVRDSELLNGVIEQIANVEGRLDGLVAAAGIQQETPALEYTAKDSNTMMEVNVTGAFMTAQAAAKQMIRFGNGGSIVMIASMSGTIANKVRFTFYWISYPIILQCDWNRGHVICTILFWSLFCGVFS